MAEVTNLRQARKRKARADKEQQAAENRVKFGRTQSEKTKIATETAQTIHRLDGLKLSHTSETQSISQPATQTEKKNGRTVPPDDEG